MSRQAFNMDAFYRQHGPDMYRDEPRHEVIAELVKGPRVLDVGCGMGDLLLILQGRFPDWELTGTEVSQVALEMAAERGVKAELILTDQIPPGMWDTIVMSQVLEHVEDDVAMVASVGLHLRDDGRFIASVPKDGQIPGAGHVREYSIESFSALLSTIGRPELHSWVGEDKRILMVVLKQEGK